MKRSLLIFLVFILITTILGSFWNCPLVVASSPILYIAKTSFCLEMDPDAQSTETTYIKNNDTGSLTWNASNDKNWLSVSPSSGTATTEIDNPWFYCNEYFPNQMVLMPTGQVTGPML